MSRRRRGRSRYSRRDSPAAITEREFVEDLYELLRLRKIWNFQRNQKLDQRGADAIVIRCDRKRVKINVMVNTPEALQRHREVNERWAKKDPFRKNILLWRHDRKLDRPTRMRALLKAIEEHNPDAE